jgi:hypothetical protein
MINPKIIITIITKPRRKKRCIRKGWLCETYFRSPKIKKKDKNKTKDCSGDLSKVKRKKKEVNRRKGKTKRRLLEFASFDIIVVYVLTEDNEKLRDDRMH